MHYRTLNFTHHLLLFLLFVSFHFIFIKDGSIITTQSTSRTMYFKNYNTLPDGVVKPSPTTTLSSTTTISHQASKSKKGMPRSLGFLLMTLFSLAIFSTRRLSSTREHTTFKLAGASTGSIVEAGAEQQGKNQRDYQIPLQHFASVPGEFAMKLSSPAFKQELTFFVDAGSSDTVVPRQCVNYGPEVTILATNKFNNWQTGNDLVQAPVTVTDTKGKTHTIDFIFWVNNKATTNCNEVFDHFDTSGGIGIMPGNNCLPYTGLNGEDLEMPSLTFALAQAYKKETNANLGFGVISEKPTHYKNNIEKGWRLLRTSIVIGDCPRDAVWRYDTYSRKDLTRNTEQKTWYKQHKEGYEMKAYHSNFIPGFKIDFFNSEDKSIDSIAGAGWLDTGGSELQYKSPISGNSKYTSICGPGTYWNDPNRSCLNAGITTNVTYTGNDGQQISWSFKSGDKNNFSHDQAFMDLPDKPDSDIPYAKRDSVHPTDFQLGNHIFYFTGGVYWDSQHQRTGILKFHTYCDSTVTHPHHEYCPSGKKCPNCGSKRCVCPV